MQGFQTDSSGVTAGGASECKEVRGFPSAPNGSAAAEIDEVDEDYEDDPNDPAANLSERQLHVNRSHSLRRSASR
jgi:hypothetical protein